MLKHARLLSLSLLVAAAAQVNAETTTFQVLLEITESCTIDAADLDFGSEVRTTTSSELTGTGSVTVECSSGTPYEIGLSNGENFNSTRRMANGSNYVPYALYKDSGHSQAWLNTGGDRVSGTGDADEQTINVYGVVAAGSLNVPQGAYSDTITATITY